jgi:1-acyl-sn-glycerol-3-phosphate acyltransferase
MANVSTRSDQNDDWRDRLTWYTYETFVIRLIKTVGRPLVWPFLKIEYTGLENIPASGPCILASNHINDIDVISFGAVMPRHPHFMAKSELYRNPVFAWFIRQGGSFPVNRGESDAWALRQAGRVLEAGQMVCMFPEGTRAGAKAQLRKGKVGAVKLALDYHAPVVPAAILGAQNFSWKKRTLITVQVGQPLDFSAMAGPPPYEYHQLRDLTTTLMQHIAAMLPPEHRGVYAEAV